MLDRGIFDEKNSQVGENTFDEKIRLMNKIYRYMLTLLCWRYLKKKEKKRGKHLCFRQSVWLDSLVFSGKGLCKYNSHRKFAVMGDMYRRKNLETICCWRENTLITKYAEGGNNLLWKLKSRKTFSGKKFLWKTLQWKVYENVKYTGEKNALEGRILWREIWKGSEKLWRVNN